MYHFTTKLLPHQCDAVNKIQHIKVGALYMEQGTGKTRTALSLINERLAAGKIKIVLWLCPCSVKMNLKNDIIYHCGIMPPNIIIKGIESLSSSDNLFLNLMRLVNDYKVYLIVDESNLVKNPDAIRTGRIITISKKCKYKLILNGTPVSKNEADLFAQWYILDWRILGYKSFFSFAANHLEYKQVRNPATGRNMPTNQVDRVLNVDYLTEKIAPYTYQIRKDECLKLPAKHYLAHGFETTDEQYSFYRDVKMKYLENVDEIRSETIYKLFTALQHVTSGRIVMTSPTQRMKTKPMFSNWHDNPRMSELQNVIVEYIGDEKCIIFAKYQSEIDDICKLITELDKSWVLFTGKVNAKDRQENLCKFKKDVQFFIANKVCGAYGLNLQFCHNIIYYSNDFDLATRSQSEDRIHRMGQEHDVYIHDIYGIETIDEFITKCLARKENLVDQFKNEIDRWKDDKNMITYKIYSAENNPDFYLKFGPFFASREIRKDLDGYPLSNEDDWQWITALDKNNIVGFMALEPKGGACHIHVSYVFPDYRKQGILKKFVKRCVDESKGTIIATIRNELEKTYTSAGFIVTGKKGKNWLNIRRDIDAKNI